MPLIFWIPIIVFSLGAARSTNSRVKVMMVDQQGNVQEKSVLKPVVIVEEEGYVSVRSGFALKGKYTPPLNSMTGNALVAPFNDRAFYVLNEKE